MNRNSLQRMVIWLCGKDIPGQTCRPMKCLCIHRSEYQLTCTKANSAWPSLATCIYQQ